MNDAGERRFHFFAVHQIGDADCPEPGRFNFIGEVAHGDNKINTLPGGKPGQDIVLKIDVPTMFINKLQSIWLIFRLFAQNANSVTFFGLLCDNNFYRSNDNKK